MLQPPKDEEWAIARRVAAAALQQLPAKQRLVCIPPDLVGYEQQLAELTAQMVVDEPGTLALWLHGPGGVVVPFNLKTEWDKRLITLTYHELTSNMLCWQGCLHTSCLGLHVLFSRRSGMGWDGMRISTMFVSKLVSLMRAVFVTHSLLLFYFADDFQLFCRWSGQDHHGAPAVQHTQQHQAVCQSGDGRA